ncbi:MAG: hypothetical protein AAF518_16030 [Spirochaetota bacterium]
MRLLFFLVCLYSTLWASGQDGRWDSSGLYQFPAQSISATLRQELSALERGSEKSNFEKISALKKSLSLYYSQFSEEKRIWEAKQRGSVLRPGSSVDEKRLFIRRVRSQFTQTDLIRNSEILYSIHRSLGDLYKQEKRNDKAIESYTTALHYRDLSQTEEAFLDESTWKEVADAQDLSARKAHKAALEKLQKARSLLKESEETYHRNWAQAGRKGATSQIPPPTVSANVRSLFRSGKAQVEQAQKNLEAVKKEYETSLQTNYLPIQKKRAVRDAQTYKLLADLVLQLEDRLQSKQNLQRQVRLYEMKPSIIFDATRTQHHPAYARLLEVAHRLDPEEPEYPRLLAQEKKAEGMKKQAVGFYEKYIDLLVRRPNQQMQFSSNQARDRYLQKNIPSYDDKTKENLKTTFLSLGILYADLRRNVLAGKNYQRFYQLETNTKEKQKWSFPIGSFLFNKLGQRDVAVVYLNTWLQSKGQETPDRVKDLGSYLQQRENLFVANWYLGKYSIYRKETFPKQEKTLSKAYGVYQELKQAMEKEKQDMVSIEKQLEEQKKQLLYKHDRDLFAKYQALQYELKQKKQRYQSAKTSFSALQKGKLLFQLAKIKERRKDLQGAESLYREIIGLGNQVELNYAYRNIQRLQKYADSGIREEIVSPY